MSGTHDRSLSFLVENGSEYRAVKSPGKGCRSKNDILILFDHPQIVKESDVQMFHKIIFWVAEVFPHVSAQDLDLSGFAKV